MGGFCEKLLPSDRWPWSDVTGLQHRPLDRVALPSLHWEWESDWYVDENFGGEPTEKGVGESVSHRHSPVGRGHSGLAAPPAPLVPMASTSTCAWLAPHGPPHLCLGPRVGEPVLCFGPCCCLPPSELPCCPLPSSFSSYPESLIEPPALAV